MNHADQSAESAPTLRPPAVLPWTYWSTVSCGQLNAALTIKVKYHFSDCTASFGFTSDQITSSDYKHIRAEVHTGSHCETASQWRLLRHLQPDLRCNCAFMALDFNCIGFHVSEKVHCLYKDSQRQSVVPPPKKNQRTVTLVMLTWCQWLTGLISPVWFCPTLALLFPAILCIYILIWCNMFPYDICLVF